MAPSRAVSPPWMLPPLATTVVAGEPAVMVPPLSATLPLTELSSTSITLAPEPSFITTCSVPATVVAVETGSTAAKASNLACRWSRRSTAEPGWPISVRSIWSLSFAMLVSRELACVTSTLACDVRSDWTWARRESVCCNWSVRVEAFCRRVWRTPVSVALEARLWKEPKKLFSAALNPVAALVGELAELELSMLWPRLVWARW